MGYLQSSWFSSFNSVSPSNSALFSSINVKARTFKSSGVLCSINSSNEEISQPSSTNSPENTSETDPSPVDPVKLAFAKAKTYKKLAQTSRKMINKQNPDMDSDGNANRSGGTGFFLDGASNEAKEVPRSVEVPKEKAKEDLGVGGMSSAMSDKSSGVKEIQEKNLGNRIMEKMSDKKGLTVSNIDFVGLGFADKKNSRGLPPGLVPTADPFPEGDSSEVEIIVGDTSKFGGARPSKPDQTQGDNSDLYKPRVSSWGVFPRPNDISKTFGGGRTIRPGEVLETEEEKAVKEARTRQLIAAYKRTIGLNIDPKLKLECEKALKDGNSLMNLGNLKEALPYFEKVMDKLTFKNELYGLAALQWSICQDSLNRTKEAQLMYEKLQSHPSPKVSKKARQFVFSFQAMEMMKVTKSSPLMNIGYQNYFEAFIENKTNYPLQETEVEVDTFSQTIPYIIFLISPIFIVLLIAVQKRI